MSDHIRTALYAPKYQALLVNRNEQADDSVTIAGKLCESGDIIIKDAKLPSSVKRGNLSCYIINWCISLLYGIQLQSNAKAFCVFLKKWQST